MGPQPQEGTLSGAKNQLEGTQNLFHNSLPFASAWSKVQPWDLLSVTEARLPPALQSKATTDARPEYVWPGNQEWTLCQVSWRQSHTSVLSSSVWKKCESISKVSRLMGLNSRDRLSSSNWANRPQVTAISSGPHTANKAVRYWGATTGR